MSYLQNHLLLRKAIFGLRLRQGSRKNPQRTTADTRSVLSTPIPCLGSKRTFLATKLISQVTQMGVTNIKRGLSCEMIVLILTVAVFCEFLGAVISQAQTPTATTTTTDQPSGTSTFTLPDKNTNPKENVSLQQIITLAGSEDYNSQLDAYFALEELATIDDLAFLVNALRKGNPPQAQLAIINVIGKLKDKQAIKGLLFELENGKLEVKRAVIRALGDIGDDFAGIYLYKILLEEEWKPAQIITDWDARLQAAIALGKIGTGDSIGRLLAARERKKNDPGLTKVIEWSLALAQHKFPQTKDTTEFVRGDTIVGVFHGMQYLFFQPVIRGNKDNKPWVFACVHDETLNFAKVYEICLNVAQKHKMAMLVPIFDPIQFSDYGNFNYRGKRADKTFLELVDYLGEKGDVRSREIFLLGVGRGGDFVHRLSVFYPHRIARAAIRAQDYVGLDTEKYFPLGLKANPYTSDLRYNMRDILKVDLAVFLPELEKLERREHSGFRFMSGVEHEVERDGILPRIKEYPLKKRAKDNWNGILEFLFTGEVEKRNVGHLRNSPE